MDVIRILYDAQRAAAGTCEWLMSNPAHLSVADHDGVDDPDHHAVTVSAPTHKPGAERWLVCIDGLDLSFPGSAASAGPEILRCELDAPPSFPQLRALFGATRSDHDRIAALAATPVGAQLAGSDLVVTSRD